MNNIEYAEIEDGQAPKRHYGVIFLIAAVVAVGALTLVNQSPAQSSASVSVADALISDTPTTLPEVTTTTAPEVTPTTQVPVIQQQVVTPTTTPTTAPAPVVITLGNLVGSDYKGASAAMFGQGFKGNFATNGVCSGQAPGKVLTQSPAPGTVLSQGAEVSVTFQPYIDLNGVNPCP